MRDSVVTNYNPNKKEIAENIGIVWTMRLSERRSILMKFAREAPSEVRAEAKDLVDDLFCDPEFYRMANLRYHDPPASHQIIFNTTIAYHYLKTTQSS